MRLTQELLNIKEAKNHLGETTYSSFASWKQACKKKNPAVWFEGDKDIAQAMTGPQPYKKGETKAIGEWDGNEGSVFNDQVKESIVPLAKIKPGQTLRWVEDGEEKIGKVVADPKYNGGMRIGGRSVKNIFDQGSTTELEIIKEDAEYAKQLVRGEKFGPGILNKIDQFITWKLFFQKDKNRFLTAKEATKQLKAAGFSDNQIHKIRDAATEAGLTAMEYVQKKYPKEVPTKYAGPNESAFQVYDLFLNVHSHIRAEFNIKFQKLFDLKIKKLESQLKIVKESREDDEGKTADKGEIGDTVVISGNVEFKDSMGEIARFGIDKKFVVVSLYGKKGEHSFHSSDVTLDSGDEDYEDEDESESFFVTIRDDDENTAFIGKLYKDDRHWRESHVEGSAPYGWGGGQYTSYLTPQQVMTWLYKDYARSYSVEGPFDDLEDAKSAASLNETAVAEGLTDAYHLLAPIGGVVKKFKGFMDFKAAILADYSTAQKRNASGKIYYLKGNKKVGAWDDYVNVGTVYYKDKAPVTEDASGNKTFTDFDLWKSAVLNSFPAQAKKMQFKGRFEGGKHTISAEIPGEDRSYGVWDGDEDYGKVLSENQVAFIEKFEKDGEKFSLWQKGNYWYELTSATQNAKSSAYKHVSEWYKKSLDEVRADLKKQGFTSLVKEGKFTVNAKTGAKLNPRTGAELPAVEKPITIKQRFAPKPSPVVAKPDLDMIWRQVEFVVGQIFPDGDPIDYMGPWMEKQGWDYSFVAKAAKKNGYKDMYDYWNDLKKEYSETMQEAVKVKSSYNDDDWYEYNPKTMTIVKQDGPNAYKSGVKGPHFDLPNGNKVVKGMMAKHKLELKEAVAYDKHSFVGRVRRGFEAKDKGWGKLGQMISLPGGIKTPWDEATLQKAKKIGRDSNRYANLVDRNLTKGGFPKAKAPHVEKFEKEQAIADVTNKVTQITDEKLKKYELMFSQHLDAGTDKNAAKMLSSIQAEIKKRKLN